MEVDSKLSMSRLRRPNCLLCLYCWPMQNWYQIRVLNFRICAAVAPSASFDSACYVSMTAKASFPLPNSSCNIHHCFADFSLPTNFRCQYFDTAVTVHCRIYSLNLSPEPHKEFLFVNITCGCTYVGKSRELAYELSSKRYHSGFHQRSTSKLSWNTHYR